MTELSVPLGRGGLTLGSPRAFPVSGSRVDLAASSGFLVVDLRGRLVGRVEGPPVSAADGSLAGLRVSFGFLWLRRCLVSADSIEQIDDGTRVIGLRVDRKALRAGRA